jgi:hypothetical protein
LPVPELALGESEVTSRICSSEKWRRPLSPKVFRSGLHLFVTTFLLEVPLQDGETASALGQTVLASRTWSQKCGHISVHFAWFSHQSKTPPSQKPSHIGTRSRLPEHKESRPIP